MNGGVGPEWQGQAASRPGWLPYFGPRLPRHTTVAAGFLFGFAPPFLVLAAANSLPPALAITAVCGLVAGPINPIFGAVQYERIPEQLQTRVLGAIKASAWIGIPFGSLLGGALTASAGLTAALLVTGGCMLVVTLAPIVFPVWRGLSHHRPAAARPGKVTRASESRRNRPAMLT